MSYGFGCAWVRSDSALSGISIGSAIVAGCMIVRGLRNPQLQFFAIFTLALVMMEVILAYGDYQFFFYRNMIYVGVALGCSDEVTGHRTEGDGGAVESRRPPGRSNPDSPRRNPVHVRDAKCRFHCRVPVSV